MPFVLRFLLAIWWIVFAVTASAVWGLARGDAPWWIPFAAPTGIVGVLAIAVFIISGPKIFRER